MYIIRCRTKTEPGKDYYVEDFWTDKTILYNTSKQHELYTWMVNVYDKIYTALEQVGE